MKGNGTRPCRDEGAGAFTLPELLLAVALGLVVTAVVTQGLMRAGQGTQRMALVLRERVTARRTLALLRSEFGAAQSWQTGTGSGAACGLGGRAPVVQLETDGRRITYSLGAAPSPIWRGLVLMRCGPAYGLDGELSGGAAQNRVVLDGLAPGGLRVEREAPGLVRVRMRQEFALRDGTVLPLQVEIRAAVPSG